MQPQNNMHDDILDQAIGAWDKQGTCPPMPVQLQGETLKVLHELESADRPVPDHTRRETSAAIR